MEVGNGVGGKELAVGIAVGEVVGICVGGLDIVGLMLGAKVGMNEGVVVGVIVITLYGAWVVGGKLGDIVGRSVGAFGDGVGVKVFIVGRAVGALVGISVGELDIVG